MRTVYWAKKLKPKAGEALFIAALAHDIERAFRQKDVLEREKLFGYADKEFLRLHMERSAQIIAEFLKEQKAGKDLIEKVKELVSKHEFGGSEEQNILKDADSISFFENNAERFLIKHLPIVGKEIVKKKIDWMYERISSEKAKKTAKPFYEKAIKKLNA